MINAATTKKIIAKLGKTISFYDRSTAQTHDNVKVTPPDKYKDIFVDGDVIKYGDSYVSFSPSGLTYEPEPGDLATIDQVKWLVQDVEKVWLDDAIIQYQTHIRKSGNTALTPSTLWTKTDRRLVPVSYRIIEDKGIDVTFHADQDYVRKVVTLSEFDTRLIDGDTIFKGDVRIYLAAQGLVFYPKSGLLVTYDSRKWLIAGEFPIYSGEQVCIYELLLRR
jgi:hypothetical protein